MGFYNGMHKMERFSENLINLSEFTLAGIGVG
jgi:hypothetical protein